MIKNANNFQFITSNCLYLAEEIICEYTCKRYDKTNRRYPDLRIFTCHCKSSLHLKFQIEVLIYTIWKG